MKAVLKISFGSILRNKRVIAVMLISIIFAVAVLVIIASVADAVVSYSYTDKFARYEGKGYTDEEIWDIILSADDLILLISVMDLFFAIAVLLVIFSVGNAFKTTEGERTRTLSVLSTLGASPTSLAVYLLFDTMIFSVIGVPLGLAGGLFLSSRLIDFFNAEVIVPSGVGAIEIFGGHTPLSFGVCAAAALLSVIFAALIPAVRLIRRPAVDIAKSTNAINVSLRETFLDDIIERKFGVTGKLAAANYQNNKPRYRSFSMTISLSSLIFVLISLIFGYIPQLDLTFEEIPRCWYILLYMLFASVFLLCIFGASGSFYTNFKRRYSEFAALESLGMEKRSLSAMVAVEAIYYGIYTFVFIAVGTFAIDYFAYYSFWVWDPAHITFIIPIKEIGAAFGCVLLITLALSLFMSLSVRKIKTVELLKNNW
ncbi:MAG: FtsX-like permease family protein [Clostridia bacterium]|nr:FtsX-like permease family protein [Clostridia bacterium]